MIKSYQEKPLLDAWINIGFFVFQKTIFKKMKMFNRFQDFISYCVQESIMYNYKHKGSHITVNSMKELSEAKKSIKNFK